MPIRISKYTDLLSGTASAGGSGTERPDPVIYLSETTAADSMLPGAVIGTFNVSIGGDWEYTLVNTLNGMFAIADNTLVVGPAGLNGFTEPKPYIVVRADQAGARIEQAFTINVTSVTPVLGVLTLTNYTFNSTDPAGTVIGAVIGKTAGSTLSISPNDGRFALAGTSLVVGLSASTGTSINISVVETLAGAVGNPKSNPVTLTRVVLDAVVMVTRLHAIPGDGSQGQLYTAPAGMTGIQWYRMSLVAPFTKTLISGATSANYTSVSADGPDVATPNVPRFRLVARGTLAGVLTDAVSVQVVLPSPLLIEGYESATVPTVITTAIGTSALVSSPKVQGSFALAHTLAGATGSPTDTRANGGTSGDLSLYGTLAFMFNAGDDPEYQPHTSVELRPITGGSTLSQTNITSRAINDSALGEQWHAFGVAALTTTPPAPGVAVLGSRMSGNNNQAPYAGTIVYDAVCGRAQNMPAGVFTFDDIYDNMDTAIPILEQYGFRATIYTAPGYLAQASHYTLAQMQYLRSRGHDFQVNGTYTDSAMTAETTLDNALNGTNGVNVVKQWVIDNGLNPDPRHGCYPFGSTRVLGNRVQIAAVTSTAASNIVTWSTGEDATTWAGRKFASSFITSPGLTIVSGGVGTATLNGNMPTTGTRPASFTDVSGAFHTGKLVTGIKSNGYLSFRTTNARNIFTRWDGGGDTRFQMSSLSGSAGTAAAFNAQDDLAMRDGTLSHMYFHGVVNTISSGLDCLVSEFLPLVQRRAALRDAGQFDGLTMDLWGKRDVASTYPV